MIRLWFLTRACYCSLMTAAKNINEIRVEIDNVDQQLIRLLASRQTLVAELGLLKKASGKPARDPEREKQLLQARQDLATTLGLNSDFVEALFQLIMSEARAQQAHAGLPLTNKA